MKSTREVDMDGIRAIIREVLESYEPDNGDVRKRYRIDAITAEILWRLEPYLKGPPISIKKLNDLAGWLQ